ncbi:fungal-specific transcription factor domain-containing protein [Microdochium trichocladiopsis]|uniref:Fungal-specific transcription factor domain-containing protein n=1 Tax=Microdochium trichocladiopsis TaxID=1682393 RepID=A0A9P8XR82_9PEZI|nr:fungal-specific transcription factor domain-containing protein [Microdochium trichocladiopsis]KAH7012483.1 fungal-specific transcription factor domain-containing protein [Microdochium trichocladiopsis]
MKSCSAETKSIRLACTECRRRKQKCSRDWPCNPCQQRNAASRCRFHHEPRLRDLIKPEGVSRSSGDDRAETPTDQLGSAFRHLGYMPSHHLSDILTGVETIASTDTAKLCLMSPWASKLERALQILPPRSLTRPDSLVWGFLHHVNFHYYIIYPSSFLEQYQTFCTDRTENRLPDLQWTCLLLEVCACATQFLDSGDQRDLCSPVQALTERYHDTARDLGSAVRPGLGHLVHVQYLLLSCYWYKTEARLRESWYVLGASIREAQELGMHEECENGPRSEFEREMRRRVWCVLNVWDWQLASFLSRPSIICRADGCVGLPNPALDGGVLSAVVPLKLQSDLIDRLTRRYSMADGNMDPPEIHEYQQEIEAWIATFPRIYDRDSPDTSMDKTHPRIVFHRHYLQTLSLAMSLRPFKSYMTRPLDTDTKLRLRNDGVEICLRLVEEVRAFLASLHPRDSRFHFTLFITFDTAAFLCSAILQDGSLISSRGEEISHAIGSAVAVLSQLSGVAKAAKPSHSLLCRLFQRATGSLATVPVPTSRVRETAMATDCSPRSCSRDALTSSFDGPSQLDGAQTTIQTTTTLGPQSSQVVLEALASIDHLATIHRLEPPVLFPQTMSASYDSSNPACHIGKEILRHYAEVQHLV